jgi:hypothetical protein
MTTPTEAREKFPVGKRVRFFPVLTSDRGLANYEDAEVRSDPWELGGQTVVKITGRAGGVSVAHLTPLPDATLPTNDGVREKVRSAVALCERDWMGGDNMAVTLCTAIEGTYGPEMPPFTENGWADGVEDEFDATLNAITDAIMTLISPAVTGPSDEAVTEVARLQYADYRDKDKDPRWSDLPADNVTGEEDWGTNKQDWKDASRDLLEHAYAIDTKPVKARELVWEDVSRAYPKREARTPIGHFTVDWDDDQKCWWGQWSKDADAMGPFGTEAEATTACSFKWDTLVSQLVEGSTDAQEPFAQILKSLESLCDPAGMHDWLSMEHPQLDGETPLSRIIAGDAASVRAILDRLETGAYL